MITIYVGVALVSISRAARSAGPGEEMRFTILNDDVGEVHEGLTTCFCEPDTQGKTLAHTADFHLGKV